MADDQEETVVSEAAQIGQDEQVALEDEPLSEQMATDALAETLQDTTVENDTIGEDNTEKEEPPGLEETDAINEATDKLSVNTEVVSHKEEEDKSSIIIAEYKEDEDRDDKEEDGVNAIDVQEQGQEQLVANIDSKIQLQKKASGESTTLEDVAMASMKNDSVELESLKSNKMLQSHSAQSQAADINPEMDAGHMSFENVPLPNDDVRTRRNSHQSRKESLTSRKGSQSATKSGPNLQTFKNSSDKKSLQTASQLTNLQKIRSGPFTRRRKSSAGHSFVFTKPRDVEEPLSSGVSVQVEGRLALLGDRDQSTDGILVNFEIMDPDEMVRFSRKDLVDRFHAALADREFLNLTNITSQNKLGSLYKKTRSDRRGSKKVELENKYFKSMSELQILRNLFEAQKATQQAEILDMKKKCREKKHKVDGEKKRLREFQRYVAVNALLSHNKKPIPAKEIDNYLEDISKMDIELSKVRYENIKIKNGKEFQEKLLRSKEELAEGLQLKDFEQLKIENQTYNEKIEERNMELLKLKKKITSTVQIMSHFKEKLYFFQIENRNQQEELKVSDVLLAKSRDILSKTKHARDALKCDNNKLRLECGLLGNESLLTDFDNQRRERIQLQDKLDKIIKRHEELVLWNGKYKKLIDKARKEAIANKWTI